MTECNPPRCQQLVTMKVFNQACENAVENMRQDGKRPKHGIFVEPIAVRSGILKYQSSTSRRINRILKIGLREVCDYILRKGGWDKVPNLRFTTFATNMLAAICV